MSDKFLSLRLQLAVKKAEDKQEEAAKENCCFVVTSCKCKTAVQDLGGRYHLSRLVRRTIKVLRMEVF